MSMQTSSLPTLSSEWVRAFLQKQVGKQALLLAVSGGLDSMVLWDLVHQTGHRYAVAHVNYHLRSEDSDLDEVFVRQLAQQRGVDVHVLSDYSIHKGSAGLQAKARELRYAFFETLSAEYPYVCTAHHGDDQVETVLLQLARGGGPKALAGISQVTNRRLRPLLPFSKAELAAYAKTREVTFREDVSNASDDYLRNRVRHHFAPIGDQLFEGFRQNISRAAQQQQSLLSFAESMVQAKIESLRSTKWPHSLDREKLAKVSGLDYFLHELLRKHDFASENVASIARATVDAVDQKRQFLNRTERVRLVISGQTIHLEKTSPFESFLLQIDTVGEYTSPLGKLLVSESEPTSTSPNAQELWVPTLDALSWRTTLAEDTLSISQTESKGAKRVLAEAKLPPIALAAASTILAGNEPIWIVGLRKSSSLKTKKAKTAGYCLRFSSRLGLPGILTF